MYVRVHILNGHARERGVGAVHDEGETGEQRGDHGDDTELHQAPKVEVESLHDDAAREGPKEMRRHR